MWYAHSLSSRPKSEWEPLYTGTGKGHLERVAELAAEFAGKFGAAEWGRIAGLWHDLGKFSAEFQDMLLRANGHEAHLETQPSRVDHATAGAQHASKNCTSHGGKVGDLIAYCIAGHHAGLADRMADAGRSGLDCRLTKSVPNWSAAPRELIETFDLPIPPITFDKHQDVATFQLSFFTRMIFSCLVDADFLATECFMSPDRTAQRISPRISISELRNQLDEYIAELVSNRPPSRVDEIRHGVLQACRAAAALPPGLFSLTVPTGGGKTLSSLAFALSHAERLQLQRVICAIPFTSIIEQTADEYRRAFSSLGQEAVLEHHCNVDPDSAHETNHSRLAAENWDAPVVVTTNVQFFESLFAAQASRCRKLHRIAKSVIVLDEAQTLPVELLKPCLAVLRELTLNYGCSIVLCTATQPALERRENFPIGLTGMREIVPKPEALYHSMRRVQVEEIGRISDEQLADKLKRYPQVLCIVNTRPHAARLFELMASETGNADDTFHLSTFMCGAHRSATITAIRVRLKENKPCRVVSTQLIEAGVDIDFPVVFRALSGIDSIAQAAGRCNREGRCERGDVFVFEPTDVQLRGYLASTASSAAELMPDATDLLNPTIVRRYFELHYWKQQGDNAWDKRGVMGCFPPPIHRMFFQFRTASDTFRFIEEVGKALFVPYCTTGERLIQEVRTLRPGIAVGRLRYLLRRLQRYTVSVHETVYNGMLGSGIELLESGYAVLANPTCYDNRLGFRAERAGEHEPEAMIA